MRKELHELLSNFSVYTIGTVSERAVLIIFLPLLTAYLSPSEFGVVAIATLATTLCFYLATPFIRATNRFYYYPEYSNERKVLLWNLFYLMCIKSSLLKIFSFVILLQPAEDFVKVYYRLEQKTVIFVITSLLQVILYCAALIISLSVFEMGILAMPISIVIRILTGIFILSPGFFRYLSFTFRPSLVVEPLKYGYPLIISSYSNYILQSGDRIILKMLTSLMSVGVYHIGYQIGSTINFIIGTPIKMALHPIAFKQEAQPQKQVKFIRRSATIYYGFALLLGLLLSLFSREIVIILTRQESYHAAWVIVPIIAFGYIQHGLGHFFGIGMIMKRKAFLQSLILIISASINIILNFILIPIIGIVGAAISTVAAYIVWNFLKAYYSKKFYQLEFEYKRLFVLTFLWTVLVITGLLFPVHPLSISILSKVGLVFSFPIILYFTGFLNSDEKELVLQVVKKIYPQRI